MNLRNTLINYSKQLVKNVFLFLITSLVFLGVSSSLFFFLQLLLGVYYTLAFIFFTCLFLIHSPQNETNSISLDIRLRSSRVCFM